MRQAVEQHMLPDFVADRDGIVFFEIAAEQLEILARKHRRGGVERVVEDHGFGLRREGSLQRVFVEPPVRRPQGDKLRHRSEEPTSELQSLMRTSYAVFCLKKTIDEQH